MIAKLRTAHIVVWLHSAVCSVVLVQPHYVPKLGATGLQNALKIKKDLLRFALVLGLIIMRQSALQNLWCHAAYVIMCAFMSGSEHPAPGFDSGRKPNTTLRDYDGEQWFSR